MPLGEKSHEHNPNDILVIETLQACFSSVPFLVSTGQYHNQCPCLLSPMARQIGTQRLHAKRQRSYRTSNGTSHIYKGDTQRLNTILTLQITDDAPDRCCCAKTHLEHVVPAQDGVLSHPGHVSLQALHALGHEVSAAAARPLGWRQRRRQHARDGLEAAVEPAEVAEPGAGNLSRGDRRVYIWEGGAYSCKRMP